MVAIESQALHDLRPSPHETQSSYYHFDLRAKQTSPVPLGSSVSFTVRLGLPGGGGPIIDSRRFRQQWMESCLYSAHLGLMQLVYSKYRSIPKKRTVHQTCHFCEVSRVEGNLINHFTTSVADVIGPRVLESVLACLQARVFGLGAMLDTLHGTQLGPTWNTLRDNYGASGIE